MQPVLDEIFRAEWGRLCATLIRLVGTSTAPEFAQEALVAALERWPFSGVPDDPGARLMTAARNRALDHLRREEPERAERPRLEAIRDRRLPYRLIRPPAFG